RLAHLADEIVGLELAARIPSDLAGDEDGDAARRDAVRVAARPRPSGWLQDSHELMSAFTCCPSVRRRNRWSLPDSVRGNASRNSMARGYLYGAIVRFTNACSSSTIAGPGS